MKRYTYTLAPFCLFILLTSFKTDTFLPDKKRSIFQHFRKKEIAEMTLELDFKAYWKKRKTNDHLPAKLFTVHPDGTEENWDIEVRPRGRLRRQVCDLPMMRLRFSEDELSERGLKKRRTLKMVNVCRKQISSEQQLLKEYLAYVMYNKITKNSLRVHLVKVKYIDSKDGEVRDEGYAFFIEHPKDLADRRDLEIVELNRVRTLSFDSDECEIFSFFQYMIGNTDWFYFNTHNLEMFRNPKTGNTVPVPYDFDYSGLVNTSYSIPDSRLNLRHVTERYYQGNCRTKEETQKTVERFKKRKEKVMASLDEVPSLDKKNRKFAFKYLERFFKVIEKDKCLKREILKHCDMWPVN